MTAEELGFLGKAPGLVTLYAALREQVLAMFPLSDIRVQKTTISFRDPMPYCYVTVPAGRIDKRRSDKYLVVTVLLGERLEHPRIAQCTEAYPGRFTHHIPLGRFDELDQPLLEWVRQSHAFRSVVTGGKARN